jgi:hypothetical protein
MINLTNILKEEKILIPRRSKEERSKNYNVAIQKQIQQYIKNGSKGDLNLSNTLITSLPNNLKVQGGLWLDKTPITTLPDDLEVKESLYLRNAKITSLPNGLKVGGSLELFNSPITSLPSDLEVGRDLWLSDTPISEKYTEDEIRQMVPGVKGDIIVW